jgi:hypothetical protein
LLRYGGEVPASRPVNGRATHYQIATHARRPLNGRHAERYRPRQPGDPSAGDTRGVGAAGRSCRDAAMGLRRVDRSTVDTRQPSPKQHRATTKFIDKATVQQAKHPATTTPHSDRLGRTTIREPTTQQSTPGSPHRNRTGPSPGTSTRQPFSSKTSGNCDVALSAAPQSASRPSNGRHPGSLRRSRT